MWAYWVEQEQETRPLADPCHRQDKPQGSGADWMDQWSEGWRVWCLGGGSKWGKGNLEWRLLLSPSNKYWGPWGTLEFDVLACIKLATVAAVTPTAQTMVLLNCMGQLNGDINSAKLITQYVFEHIVHIMRWLVIQLHTQFDFFVLHLSNAAFGQYHFSLLSIFSSSSAYYTQQLSQSVSASCHWGQCYLFRGSQALQPREHIGTW